MLVNQSKQVSNQSQKSISLPWAWHSSAPACCLNIIKILKKQAGAELGQAQVKLEELDEV